MDFSSIFSAILAGGLAGQIVTLFWGDNLTEKREFNKWLVQEKFKLYSELLSLIAYTPRDVKALQTWPLDIRDLSLKIYLLFPSGAPPQDIKESMEEIFQLAKRKKGGEDSDGLSAKFREAIRDLRQALSRNLHSVDKRGNKIWR